MGAKRSGGQALAGVSDAAFVDEDGEIVSEVDGVECVSEARMTARSEPFYVGRHPSPTFPHRLRYGVKPDTAWFQKGAGYSPDRDAPRPSAVARVVAGKTKCGNTILHPECAGVFTGRIELHGFMEGTSGETLRPYMHWSHRSPTPPTTPLPQSCLRGEDRWHALAAIGLMVSGGPTIRQIGTMTIPSPKSSMLTKRRFTLTWTERTSSGLEAGWWPAAVGRGGRNVRRIHARPIAGRPGT